MPLIARRTEKDRIHVEELHCDDDGFYLVVKGTNNKNEYRHLVRLKDDQVDAAMKKFGV